MGMPHAEPISKEYFVKSQVALALFFMFSALARYLLRACDSKRKVERQAPILL
jgi:hypothetical protein